MGGALAVHTALLNSAPANNVQTNETMSPRDYDQVVIQNLVGVCVIDVVEGTAMEALSSMQSFLRSRPKSFQSIGIFYHLQMKISCNHLFDNQISNLLS